VIALLTSPTLLQIQTAAEWLASHPYPNPDLEIALNLVLQGRIIPQETGERVAIALRATKSFAYCRVPRFLGSDAVMVKRDTIGSCLSYGT